MANENQEDAGQKDATPPARDSPPGRKSRLDNIEHPAHSGAETSSAYDNEFAFELNPRERKLVVIAENRAVSRVEGHITHRIDSESRYAGLPANDVLADLDSRFPKVNFPERMMARLEKEQEARHNHEERQDAVDLKRAENEELEIKEAYKAQFRNSAIALAVFFLLIGLAVWLVVIDQPGLAAIIFATTIGSLFASGYFLNRTTDQKGGGAN